MREAVAHPFLISGRLGERVDARGEGADRLRGAFEIGAGAQEAEDEAGLGGERVVLEPAEGGGDRAAGGVGGEIGAGEERGDHGVGDAGVLAADQPGEGGARGARSGGGVEVLAGEKRAQEEAGLGLDAVTAELDEDSGEVR